MIHMWRRCRRPWRISLTRHPSKTSSNSISHSLRPGHAVEDHHHHHRQSALLHQEKKKTETKILQSSPPLSLLPVQPPSFPGVFFLYAAAASATLASAIAAVITLSDGDGGGFKEKVYSELKGSLVKSNNSLRRICEQLKQTGIAASVLGKSLRSVLSSANQEVRSGFELRVAALLADISAASESRRSAIVAAGGGAVVDWLLETVSCRSPTQVESARALSYLISDPNVCEAVLARPHAVPHLLRFIFSSQPYLHPSNHNNNNDTKKKKQIKHSSTDGADILKGRSMLIAAIMDIVTSSCDSLEGTSFQPSLPGQADTRDIAEALQVVEEGGMQLDETRGDDDDGDDDDDDEVGGTGVRGIGIKILGGTSVLGFSRTGNLLKLEHSASNHYESSLKNDPGTLNSQKNNFDSNVGNLASISVSKIRGSGLCTRTTEFRGLWDDLQSQHVAVPFSAWALANWALASEPNRSLIQELDRDGHAIMTALMAPERTVKWHGSLVARLLLEDKNLPLTDSVPDWSFSLLSTISQATKNEDFALARVAFSAFLVSVERCNGSRTVVMSKGLHLMRDIAKQTETNRHVQEAVAKALELLSTGGDSHLSLEESQKWSSILLPWVCGKFSSDAMKVSATKILSCILEDYGPASIPISQGWLTLLLTELLDISKPPTIKGNSGPLKSDNFKTQIDQSNAQSAVQIAGQLANAVVSLARSQLGTTVESVDEFPLADLLSLEPFYVHFKDKKKNGLPRFDAADSALATLKGIKALAEICAEDSKCQKKIANSGVLCLLRRFLLRDDYEQLAAIEAYDASRVLEAQERVSSVPGGDSSVPDANDPSSSVRVPPTGHIRRHAARLLSILSLLPKVQQIIIRDGVWCKWLEDCANGRVPGCNDLKIQSYARATLLNISCSQQVNGNITEEGSSDMEIGNQKNLCPRYDDMLFLINPELPHWKCYAEDSSGTSQPDSPGTSQSVTCHNNPPSPHQDNEDPDFGISSAYVSGSNESTQAVVPLVDIVFVHGLRGGPFKTWRIADNKSSTTSKSGLVEKIDQEAGKQGTCWPREWLATDFPCARLFTVKYKTNLTQWSGASLPLQEVSSILLKKLLAAGIGDRPVVFVTHSMGGLVVKQMLYQAKIDNFIKFINNTVGVVFYSCPHFGSKLADMPWHMGLVFRPAPSIGELRSGSSRLVELNDFVRHLHNKGLLEVLSFSETKVTPIVEGYGGWAFRVEIVPIESAYPGFGELVVLDATDHINSCKPVNRTDPSYNETLEFLLKFKERAKEYVKK